MQDDARLLFFVPPRPGPIYTRRLKETSLLSFYTQNQQDFLAVVRVEYFLVKKRAPEIGALANYKKGFEFFCDALTQYFLAAPTLGHGKSTDDDGLNVNFFGEAILNHLDSYHFGSIQNLYGGGRAENSPEWHMVRDLIYVACIDALGSPTFSWGEKEDQEARGRISELMRGERTFKACSVPKGKLFH